MRRARYGVAVAALLIVIATAWFADSARTSTSPLDSLLALMAFSMKLAGGGSMGFVFLILAAGRTGWVEAMLTANAALILLAAVRKDAPRPDRLLKSLVSTTVAAAGSHGAFLLATHYSLKNPIPYMAAAFVCFIAMHLFDWKRSILWPFTYYLVAAATDAFSPIPAALPLLLFITWRSFRAYEHRLSRQDQQSMQVRDLQFRTIETLARAIEARGRPLKSGSRRVAVYTAEMALELDLTEEERDALRVAALLYDVGEMAIPETILAKPGKLTAEEFEKVRTHPIVAAGILEHAGFPYPVEPIVLAHHERWDGTGYPKGLEGTQIPMGARILAAADAIDALASPRYHRPPISVEDAVAVVVAGACSAYDPAVVALIQKRFRTWERKIALDPQDDFTERILSAQRDAQTLFDLTAKLGASLDLEEIYEALRSMLRQIVPYDTLVVWRERRGILTAERVLGDPFPALAHAKIPWGAGLSGDAAATQRTIVNGAAQLDLGSSQATSSLPFPFRYAMAVPFPPGQLKGAATLYLAGERQFTSEHARILNVVGPKLAAALTNGIKFNQARSDAGVDSLTGLPNAASLTAQLANLHQPCAVILCDLDGFKDLNDRYGHMIGDRVLRAVGEGFRSSCREGDFVARLGGDEFVLLLRGAHTDDWAARLEGFKEMVRQAGRTVTGTIVVEASVGVAFFPTEGRSTEELIATADERMYQEKRYRRKLGLIQGGRATTS